jgi:Tol biopolymer transport system component
MVALAGEAVWWTGRSRGVNRDQLPRPVARDLKRLTFDPGLQTDVTWSPDGQRIAYASDKGGNFDIWAQEARGSLLRVKQINPEIGYAEMDIAGDRLALTLRSVSGGSGC